MYALLALSTFVLSVAAGNAIWELSDARATVYYDLTDQLCDDTFYPNWGVTSGINFGIPFCEGQGTSSLANIGSNSIVAMNATMIQEDPAKYCGKEVQILDSSGNQLNIGDGPLYIWDACAACSTATIIDLSALAFTGLKGGSCAGNNPEGLTVNVMDNNIVDWTGIGSSAAGSGQDLPPQTNVPASDLPSSTPPAVPASPPTSSPVASNTPIDNFEVVTPVPSTASSPADTALPQPPSSTSNSTGPSRLPAESSGASGAGSDCTYGAWQCDSLAIQICSYTDDGSLGWITIDNCPTHCEFSSTGNVDCS